MRYTTANVTKAKAMLISRMSYLVSLRLRHITGRKLAESIHMSPGIISKLRNNVTKGISFEAVLEAAERLDVRYTLTMGYDSKGRRDVQLQMEDIESTRVRALAHNYKEPKDKRTRPAV